jgi:iron complex outermembrane recepter protein
LRKAGQEGKAIVEFIVTTNGDVVDAHVINDCDPLFARAAIAAVLKWKFSPGMRDGRIVNTKMSAPIEFQLPSQTEPNKPPRPTPASATPPVGAPIMPPPGAAGP